MTPKRQRYLDDCPWVEREARRKIKALKFDLKEAKAAGYHPGIRAHKNLLKHFKSLLPFMQDGALLRPCPLCGNRHLTVYFNSIECPICGCKIDGCKNKKDAIIKWNRRR